MSQRNTDINRLHFPNIYLPQKTYINITTQHYKKLETNVALTNKKLTLMVGYREVVIKSISSTNALNFVTLLHCSNCTCTQSGYKI